MPQGRRCVVLDWLFFAVAIPAAIMTGMSKGGFGGSLGFAATPLVALVVDPVLALGLMLPLFMIMDVAAMRIYWRKWHGPSVRALLLGGVPGVALGVGLYAVTDARVLGFLLGFMAVAFVLFQAARGAGWVQVQPAPFSAKRGTAAGLMSGFGSFVSHAGGPPVLMFLLPLGLDKTRFHATTVAFYWVINIAKAVPYAFLGFFTAETLLANAILLPVAFFGVWLGVKAQHMIPERIFFAVTYTFLLIAGARLMWMAFG